MGARRDQGLWRHHSRVISIHAPAWGRDTSSRYHHRCRHQFQSTRPHGGATSPYSTPSMSLAISIHAPAWGRDITSQTLFRGKDRFQSTRPHGGATGFKTSRSFQHVISIHAPAWGRDVFLIVLLPCLYSFQSTRPHGGATPRRANKRGCHQFQSTRPHGGATTAGRRRKMTACISIHAPAWGRDFRWLKYGFFSTNFNPRARMGARRYSPLSPLCH